MTAIANSFRATPKANHQVNNNRESNMESAYNDTMRISSLSNVPGIRKIAMVVAALAVGAILIIAATLPGAAMADEQNRPLISQQPDIFDEGGTKMFGAYKLRNVISNVDIFDEGGTKMFGAYALRNVISDVDILDEGGIESWT